MARRENRLNDLRLRAAVEHAQAHRQAESFPDGNGLKLVVTDAGRARFVHRYPFGGKYKTMWLDGTYPRDVGLADARRWRDANNALIDERVDPQAARTSGEKADPTLAEFARLRFLDLAPAHEHADGPERSVWFADITRRCPGLAKMKIDAISGSHVEAELSRYWVDKKCRPTGKRIAQVLARVFRARHSSQRRDLRYWQNPADWETLCDNLGRKPHKTKHRKALPFVDVPAFVKALRLHQSMAARALEWIILTGCRAGEGAGAKWGEIDLLGLTWTIPPERLKTEQGKGEDGQAFVVPLSLAAAELLHRVRENREGFDLGPEDLIFPGLGLYRCPKRARKAGLRRYQYSTVAIWRRAKMVNPDITVHGFRSSLVAWGKAVGHPELGRFALDVMDRCLGHMIGAKTAADENTARLSQALGAYAGNGADPYLPERTIAMRAWGDFVDGVVPAAPPVVLPAAPSNVVALPLAA